MARDWWVPASYERLAEKVRAIGREKHPEPADPAKDEHFHIYLKFGKKYDLANRLQTTVFDLRGRGRRVLHPEIQAVKNTALDRERVINYDDQGRRFRMGWRVRCDRAFFRNGVASFVTEPFFGMGWRVS